MEQTGFQIGEDLRHVWIGTIRGIVELLDSLGLEQSADGLVISQKIRDWHTKCTEIVNQLRIHRGSDLFDTQGQYGLKRIDISFLEFILSIFLKHKKIREIYTQLMEGKEIIEMRDGLLTLDNLQQ